MVRENKAEDKAQRRIVRISFIICSFLFQPNAAASRLLYHRIARRESRLGLLIGNGAT